MENLEHFGSVTYLLKGFNTVIESEPGIRPSWGSFWAVNAQKFKL